MGLFALVCGLVLYEFLFKQGFKITMKKTIIIILCMVVIFIYTQIDIDSSKYAIDAFKERTKIWNTLSPYIKDDLLLGKGLGSYELYRPKVYKYLSPHNVYLSILFELGFLGLSIIFLYIGFIIYDLIISRNVIHDFEKNPVGLSIILTICLFAITDSAPFSQVVALNSWVLLGCLSKNYQNNQEEQK
jgi:O-antigen ligase